MSRWYEHPCTSNLLEGDQILNVMSYINEAKDSFKATYGDINSKEAPLEQILKMWPDKSDVRKEWLRKVIDGGPMNDKMQSMVTVISHFPMHSFYYLDHLISLVNQNKKRFAITASELLADVFFKFLLPNIRPLLNMKERPLSRLDNLNTKPEKKKKKDGAAVRAKILAHWYYEEQLKTRYFRFLRAMEEMLKNEVDKTNKLKMINLLSRLCQLKENQTIIIEIMVNKLGDIDKKVIGTTLSKLGDLENEFKSLTPVIVRSIRKFVFRPNLSPTAQYYAIQLLARTKFDSNNLESMPLDIDDDPESHTTKLPMEVIQIYIGVLKRLLQASKTKYEKLYSAIMCGMARAIPYAAESDVAKYTSTIYKLVHSSNLNLAIQGLKVLFTMVSSSKGASNELDRYQRLVYRILVNPTLLFNSHRTRLVEIFFKSVSIDEDTQRVKAMIKRLLQVCLAIGEPGFICVCLLYMSRLTKSRLRDVLKVQKIDAPVNGAEVTKMPFISGAELAIGDESDDDDEVVPDIVSDNEDEQDVAADTVPTSSWLHKDNKDKVTINTDQYDPFALDPKYANVDKEQLIELTLLTNHTHPSVKLFAEKILKMEPIDYKSDPSEDFSLAKFLDRFAFRNPKDIKNKRKIMHGSSKLVSDPVRKIAVNTKQFADIKESNIPIDELFFHKYFNHSKKTSKSNQEEIDEDFEDSDTEFDALLGKMDNESEDDISMAGSDMDDDFCELSDYYDDEDGEEDDFGSMDNEKSEEEGAEAEAGEEERMDIDDEEMEFDDDGEDDESSDEQPTLHSSKRKKLGAELASITSGAMASGNAYESVQENYQIKRKLDRKKRKGKNPKSNKKESKIKVKKPKTLKRKSKK